jgi:hypothetical protein
VKRAFYEKNVPSLNQEEIVQRDYQIDRFVDDLKIMCLYFANAN